MAVAIAAAHHVLARCRRRRTLVAWLVVLGGLDIDDELDSEDNDAAPRVKRTRPAYSQSAWGKILESKAPLVDHTSPYATTFQKRFRLP